MKLKGKVAIVTGGGGGIGSSMARGLGQEGAKVVIGDIVPERATAAANALTKAGVDALGITLDVTRLESIDELVKKTADRFGRIDILINSAAVFARHTGRASVPFFQVDLSDWDKAITVNLRGAFLCCRAVFPFMKKQGGGKIINMASVSCLRGAPNFAHYVASKGGVIGLTKAMAREIGQYGINVNCIAPGSTFSEDSNDQAALKFRKQAIARRSIKRVEYPDDLVGAAVFLASPDSDFVTGQTLIVDGGEIMH